MSLALHRDKRWTVQLDGTTHKITIWRKELALGGGPLMLLGIKHSRVSHPADTVQCGFLPKKNRIIHELVVTYALNAAVLSFSLHDASWCLINCEDACFP